MRNADFDVEPNSSLDQAQAIIGPQVAGQRWVMGSLAPATVKLCPARTVILAASDRRVSECGERSAGLDHGRLRA
jgi:hypothetical protein